MKQTFKIPVVFKVKAKTQEEAEQFVYRVMGANFGEIYESEPKTYKAIKWWEFAEIRSRKCAHEKSSQSSS